MQRDIHAFQIRIATRPIRTVAGVAAALVLASLIFIISSASSTVAVPVRTDGGSTLQVSMAATQVVSSNTVNFDFSQSIKRPSTWSDSQYVAIEVSLTTAGNDAASVYRGAGSCKVDLSSSANAGTFGTTQGDGLVSLTGVSNQIFVLNDQTPQLSLDGRLDDILTALKYVQVSCSAQSDLVSKYVRLGAVPSIFQDTSGCTASASIYPCDGPLLYLFSTQHYYRLAYKNHSTPGDAQIAILMNDAKTRSIDVDGSANSGATARYGWVATLSTQDEIRLTNALNQPAVSMIGTTDEAVTWTWDTTKWGPVGSNAGYSNSSGNSNSDCATSEGDFRWLGPDVWCLRVPAQNVAATGRSTNNTQRFWLKDSSGQWVTQASSTGALIDFQSTLSATNGLGLYHSWNNSSGAISDPNNSGNFVYQASGIAVWDDTGNAGPWKNYFLEYCDPNHTCPPPDDAVASTQLKLTQTITFSGASTSYSTSSVSLNRATSTSSLQISYSSSTTSVCTTASADNGTTVSVTLLAQGICTVTASNSGNDNYLAATDVSQSFTSTYGTASTGLNTSCTNVGSLQNGSFETFTQGSYNWAAYNSGPAQVLQLPQANVSPWSTTATDHTIEIQRQVSGFAQDGTHITGTYYDSYNARPAAGTYMAEINANSVGGLYQDISTIPGTTIHWSIKHRGRKFSPGTAGASSTATDNMKVRIGPTSGVIDQIPDSRYTPTSGIWGIPSYSNTADTWTPSATLSDSLDTGWRLYTGTYVVPSGQTTTRFQFESTDAGTIGNYLDDITFTPTIACPDTTTIKSGRNGVNFNPLANDYYPSGTSVSIVSTSTGGSAVVSGTNISLSANSAGSFVVQYRITDSYGNTSDSTIQTTVLPEVSSQVPTTVLVDPRKNFIDLPTMNFSGPTNALLCINESDANGNLLGSPVIKFDASTKGSSDSSGAGSSTISGDRSTSLLIRHSLANASSTLNSSGGLRAYLDSGNFTSIRYLYLRTSPLTNPGDSDACSDSLSTSNAVIKIQPLDISQAIRKGKIVISRNP